MALSKALDRLSWIRILWAWVGKPSCNWRQPEQILQSLPYAAAITDCKSLYDLATRTAIPACEELRTTLECLLIRERLAENTVLRWTHTGAMLADCLTKSMEGHVLREALRIGKFRLVDEEAILKEKSDKRQRIRWLNQVPSESQWSFNKQLSAWTFVHTQQRLLLFSPLDVPGGPAEAVLDNIRDTVIYFNSGKTDIIRDNWRDPEETHRALHDVWHGETTFYLRGHAPQLN
jgi:hypothetical protein